MAGDNYGRTSNQRLDTTHPDIQRLMRRVGPHFANTILEGERSEEQQRKNVEKGVSKTMDSNHLHSPSDAVDAAPDPLAWPQAGKLKARIESVAGQLTDEQGAEIMALVEGYVREVARWYYFGGFVLGYAEELNVDIRWGGDWDGDRKLEDQTFHDLPHFEIKL
ncbi:MAG: hypothetical protein KAJ42_08835 [Gemmatimonadetes bacterium]|nr:hypothetical protein [Gemmatimonadota bacterium]